MNKHLSMSPTVMRMLEIGSDERRASFRTAKRRSQREAAQEIEMELVSMLVEAEDTELAAHAENESFEDWWDRKMDEAYNREMDDYYDDLDDFWYQE